MKIDYLIYCVTDKHGNQDAVVVNESSDTVQICGMKSTEYEVLHFEDSAYHLCSWCEEYGLELKEVKMSTEV